MCVDSNGEADLENKSETTDRKGSFDFEQFIKRNRYPVLIALSGLILAGLGAFLYLNTNLFEKDKIEVIEKPSGSEIGTSEIIVEIAGSVEKPGVYKLVNDSRVEDLLISCGGLSADADRSWVERYVNRAAKLSDGQKVYIRSVEEANGNALDKQITVVSANGDGGNQTTSSVLGVENAGLTNINSASFEELDKLPGIGQVYGKKIIEQRPYSNVEELLSRKIIPASTFDKIKDKISIY